MDARAHRDRALSLEAHRAKRLEKYSAYFDALARRDPTLMVALAATQLNLAPADRTPLITSIDMTPRSAEVFTELEPEFVPPQVQPAPDSLLHKLATSDAARPWVIVIGGVSVLCGLLSSLSSSSRGKPEETPVGPAPEVGTTAEQSIEADDVHEPSTDEEFAVARSSADEPSLTLVE